MATGGTDSTPDVTVSTQQTDLQRRQQLLQHAQTVLNESADWTSIIGYLYTFLTEQYSMDSGNALLGLTQIMMRRLFSEAVQNRLGLMEAVDVLIAIEEKTYGDRGPEMTAIVRQRRQNYGSDTRFVMNAHKSMNEQFYKSFVPNRSYTEKRALLACQQLLGIYRHSFQYLQRTDVQRMDALFQNILLINEVVRIRKQLESVDVEASLIQDLRDSMETKLLSNLLGDMSIADNFDSIRKYVSIQYSDPTLQYLLLRETASLSEDDKLYRFHFLNVQHVLDYSGINNPHQRQHWLNYIKIHLNAMIRKSVQATADDRARSISLFYHVSYLCRDQSYSEACLQLYKEQHEFDTYVRLLENMVESLETDHDEMPSEILEIRAQRFDLRMIDDEIPDLDILLQPWWLTGSSDSTQIDLSHAESRDPSNVLDNYPSNSSTQESTQYSKTCPKSQQVTGDTVTVEFTRMVPRLDQTSPPKASMHDVEFNSLQCTDEIVPNPQREILYTNLKRDTKYHGRCYGYDPMFRRWWYMNVMVYVRDIKQVARAKQGASRDLIDLSVSTEESSEHDDYVMKIEREELRHEWNKPCTYTTHQSLALHYVNRFNCAIHQCQIQSFVFLAMLEVNLLVLFEDSRSGKVVEFGSLERCLSQNKEYVRFSSNTDYVNKDLPGTEMMDFLMAFSHYTYDKSAGTLLISDLQGILCAEGYEEDSDYTRMLRATNKGLMVLLTDPVIHTTIDEFDYPGFNNWGVEGFQLFFTQQHTTCNKFCTGLGLTRPERFS